MTHDEIKTLLASSHSMFKTLSTGELAGVTPYLFTGALQVGIDEIGYSYRFCYPTVDDAEQALVEWDGHGDPPGPWIKQKGKGKDRLNPNSDVWKDL